MFKNKSYIGISFIILVFGILVIPKIIDRIKNNEVVSGVRLDKVSKEATTCSSLVVIGKAPQFSLQDQNNKTISNKDFEGKVYLVEFFFTTCPTICPKMNLNMVAIQNKFFGNPNFGIASITINPENDTTEVLKAHAAQIGVQSSKWHLLTGDKDYIYSIANKGFNVYVGENKKTPGGFEHSGLFALVDKNGNIRCRKDDYGNPILYYDGIEKQGVVAIQQDIAILLRE